MDFPSCLLLVCTSLGSDVADSCVLSLCRLPSWLLCPVRLRHGLRSHCVLHFPASCGSFFVLIFHPLSLSLPKSNVCSGPSLHVPVFLPRRSTHVVAFSIPF